MPTFKINKTVGILKKDKSNSNTYVFTPNNGKNSLLKNIDKKIFINKHEILLHGSDGWTKLSVNNIKKDETFNLWTYFKCEEMKQSVSGWTDKNEPFVLATYDDGARLVMIHGDTIIDATDEMLTMVVYQRNSPGTSRFDCTWCFHESHKCLTTVHDKESFDTVHEVVSDITDNVFDNGPDPYDWKTFLTTQKKQGGEEEDWIGVFAPLTSDDEGEEEDEDYNVDEESEEEEEDDVEEEEEEFDDDESETDEDSSEFELETGSEVSSDDMEGGEYVSEEEYVSVKRRRLD